MLKTDDMVKPTFYRDLAGLFFLASVAITNDPHLPFAGSYFTGAGMGFSLVFIMLSFWKK